MHYRRKPERYLRRVTLAAIDNPGTFTATDQRLLTSLRLASVPAGSSRAPSRRGAASCYAVFMLVLKHGMADEFDCLLRPPTRTQRVLLTSDCTPRAIQESTSLAQELCTGHQYKQQHILAAKQSCPRKPQVSQ